MSTTSSFTPPAVASSSSAVPLVIATGDEWGPATNTQAYAPLDIIADGELVLDGELVFG